MRALKSIVRGFFAIQAAAFLLIPLAAILGGLRSHVRVYLAHTASGQALRTGAMLVVYGIVAGIMAIGLVNAVAWWTTRQAAPVSRAWAIAASIASIAQGILLLFFAHFAKGRTSFSSGDGLLWIGLGVAGIILFARKEATAATPPAPATRTSVAGDRTTAASFHAVNVLSGIAQIAAIVIWARWAHLHDLPRTSGLMWIAFFAIASVLTTIIHECGHALIAWCFEMSLLSFKAGPFQWTKREGKWEFKLHLAGLLTPGGAVGAVSKDPGQPRWEKILLIAAGPLANLVIGIPAIYAVLHDYWPHYQQTWGLAAFTASFCVIAASVNLVPFLSEEGSYSDGACILQIVTNSSLVENHRSPALDESADTAVATAAPAAAPPVSAAVSRKDEAASPPILPAWITPAPAPALQVRNAAAALDAITLSVPPAPATSANSYSDSASMFARLPSLTSGDSEVTPADADRLPEQEAKTAPAAETVEAGPEPPFAPDKPESRTRVLHAQPSSNVSDVAKAAASDPYARILPSPDRSLVDLVPPPGSAPASSPATWSAKSSAPPLAGAPSITPLALAAWTSLPPLSAPSFSPTTVQPPSRGPSVPAAFARRPRIVGLMPEDPFAVQPAAGPELPAVAAVESTPDDTAPAHPTGAAAEPGALFTATPPHVVETPATPSPATSPTERVQQPAETAVPESAPPTIEPPRHDPLTFFRAAAIENLSTGSRNLKS